ncbi:uroporphyrin-III methyltransferase [Sulfurifustis variabilis]|uniref:Uroporphyrin-III methyltransferase n=1 Tax=Sulfurifustis variabilis TaxID=1675686 RepID=A0A1B4V5T3_9GAMM|nr:DUF488 family protein [Sulfurifustis variabilis]BAU48906.1 uroporphyrin-III methyltransferase [Sulfurifustis variabilis]
MAIQLKRAYVAPASGDGERILIDRLWPRGVSKDEARIDIWLKELAPSDGLRRWFNHDPARWPEFKARYFRELASHRELLAAISRRARRGRVTLVYGAKDEKHNNAVALRELLRRRKA